MTMSMWWPLLAFWLGGVLGFLVAAMLAVGHARVAPAEPAGDGQV
jgi:hypothetical protein